MDDKTLEFLEKEKWFLISIAVKFNKFNNNTCIKYNVELIHDRIIEIENMIDEWRCKKCQNV